MSIHHLQPSIQAARRQISQEGLVLITQSSIQAARRMAHEYRQESGRHAGVVVIFNNQVCGWVNTLRDPQHWQPGALAVSADAVVHLAHGGNDYDGATAWSQVAS